jgi:hypothetical protein
MSDIAITVADPGSGHLVGLPRRQISSVSPGCESAGGLCADRRDKSLKTLCHVGSCSGGISHAYVSVLSRALKPGGLAVIGTFAPDGPEKCSGLTVARHDSESLCAILGETFELLASHRVEHATPWGTVQRFQFSTFKLQP